MCSGDLLLPLQNRGARPDLTSQQARAISHNSENELASSLHSHKRRELRGLQVIIGLRSSIEGSCSRCQRGWPSQRHSLVMGGTLGMRQVG